VYRAKSILRPFILLLVGILLSRSGACAQQAKGETYKILGVSVEGNDPQSGTEPSAIIERSGLKVGDEITVPGEQVRQAITRLWSLKIFSDIQIIVERKVEDGAYLLIKLAEYPRLSHMDIHGADDISQDDINKKISIVKGQILTPNDVNRILQTVKKMYEEEGHLMAEIKSETVKDDSSKSSRVILKLDIDEGPRVTIDKIHFAGNVAVPEDDLKGTMDDTKEKSWWQFWSRPKLEKKKFEDDKDRVLKYYRKHGYLDAEISSDSTWYSPDKKKVSVLINVREGPQYKVRSITWDGATVYKPEVLTERLGFHSGDVFDQERFDQNLRNSPDQTDVASLYLDNGYLMFSLEPEFIRIHCDSASAMRAVGGNVGRTDTPPDSGCLDIAIHVLERNQFRVGKVDIKGNTKTHDYVIRRELKTKPGDYFSRAAIMRSLRQLSQLNYFNPEKLKPDYKIVDDKTVDLTYEVEEKSSDNVNASVGYSGVYGVTGAIGFTISNFALKDPLGGGAGQMLSFQWQFGEGARFRTFSLGFTEPWLNNTPTTLGVSLFDTRQIYGVDLEEMGVSVRLGRQLKWPDDYFRADWTVRYQDNDVHDNGGIVLYQLGKTTQYSVNQTISRNSTDSPIFPTIGSIVALSIDLSGPPLLPGNVSYHKELFNAEFFTPVAGSSRLVIYTSTSLGYIDGFRQDANIPYLEKFFMGGTGIGYAATTPLRGYDDRSIGPRDVNGNEIGGNVMVKHTAELRLAVTLNPMPIYLLGFVEGGNVFADFTHADLFDLKRSYGFGARILINPIGMVGFDYGYGADHVLSTSGGPDGWRFHFQFGKGF